jgi:hypothetical protein
MNIYGLNINDEYPFLKYIKSNFNIDFYCDTTQYVNNKNKKIYIQIEPNSIINNHDFLAKNSHLYDYIVCHDASYIKNNGISYFPAVTWLSPIYYENVDISQKKFKISHMSGHKSMTIGHNVRKEIYMNQNLYNKYPIIFYRSVMKPHLPNINNNPFIPDECPIINKTNHTTISKSSKVVLFIEYQFSIIIENTKESNYFSEKLIDCLLMKTIPIYYGCPNINKIFNTNGWIIIESITSNDVINELMKGLHTLNEFYYDLYKDVIEENYKLALKYCNFSNNLLNGLKQIPFIELNIS